MQLLHHAVLDIISFVRSLPEPVASSLHSSTPFPSGTLNALIQALLAAERENVLEDLQVYIGCLRRTGERCCSWSSFKFSRTLSECRFTLFPNVLSSEMYLLSLWALAGAMLSFRFHSEYEGHATIGKGRFGEVFSAVGRMDRFPYAIKRVEFVHGLVPCGKCCHCGRDSSGRVTNTSTSSSLSCCEMTIAESLVFANGGRNGSAGAKCKRSCTSSGARHCPVRICMDVAKEAQALAALNHKNIVRVFSSWVEVQAPFFVISPSNRSLHPTARHVPAAVKMSYSSIGSHELSGEVKESSDPGGGIARRERESMTRDCKGGKGNLEEEEASNDESIPRSGLESRADADTRRVVSREEGIEGKRGDADTRSVGDSREEGRSLEELALLQSSADNAVVPAQLSKLRKPQLTYRYCLYIAMEVCSGGSLRQYLRTRMCIEPDKSIRILRDLVKGLRHVHRCGLVHRDIKPSNILFDAGGRLKIGDFGLAQVQTLSPQEVGYGSRGFEFEGRGRGETGERSTKGRSAVGTVPYMAPEVQSGAAPCTTASDMFSVGMVGLELFHYSAEVVKERRTASSHVTRLHQLRKSLRSEQHLPQAPHSLAPLLISLLEPRPSLRPSATQMLRQPLFTRHDFGLCEGTHSE